MRAVKPGVRAALPIRWDDLLGEGVDGIPVDRWANGQVDPADTGPLVFADALDRLPRRASERSRPPQLQLVLDLGGHLFVGRRYTCLIRRHVEHQVQRTVEAPRITPLALAPAR